MTTAHVMNSSLAGQVKDMREGYRAGRTLPRAKRATEGERSGVEPAQAKGGIGCNARGSPKKIVSAHIHSADLRAESVTEIWVPGG